MLQLPPSIFPTQERLFESAVNLSGQVHLLDTQDDKYVVQLSLSVQKLSNKISAISNALRGCTNTKLAQPTTL